jgi:hypothetical protein
MRNDGGLQRNNGFFGLESFANFGRQGKIFHSPSLRAEVLLFRADIPQGV